MLTIDAVFMRSKVGLTAGLLTVAAVTPVAVAHAQPVSDVTLPASPLTSLFGTDPILGPVDLPTETPWWWVGDSPNPHPALLSFAPLAPTATTILDFQPLALVPGFLQPIARPILGIVPQINVCVGGLGVSLGAYGRVSVKSSAC